jgi:hypothetical protein
MRKAAIGVGLVILMAVGAGPARADKCNGAKIKTIGKKEAGLLGCSAKEATKDGVQPTCNSTVSGKFTPAYDKPTGCVPAAPSDTTCETAADSCQSTLRTALPDGNGTTPSKCEAARLKAAGKLASGELGCYSKASAKALPVDTVGCIPKNTGKFAAAFNKVTGCAGDGNASGIQTSVENNCVKNMVAVDGGGNVTAITCGGATTTTTTATSSTTTTTSGGACCGINPTRLSFTTGIGSGNCGMVQTSTGTVTKNLACSGLYTGGGGNTVPLPYAVPDMGSSLTGVGSCNAGALTLTNLTSAQTGSNRNCTSVGCLFGPPLPIPNAGSTPTSVCVVNVVATNAAGTANCNTGSTHLNLPLTSQLYLDGDLFPNAPGIQVCPVCNKTCSAGTNLNGPCNVDADCPGGGAGSCGGSNKCHGGPNDGNACAPADTGINQGFPTSHDCPPPAVNSIGGLPIAFDLVTGTKTATAVNNTASAQNQIFCGYCRDVNNLGSGCFAGDQTAGCPTPLQPSPIQCENLGTGGLNAACPATYPDCEERSGGAFGPAGGGAHTITETGSPAGNMTDGASHASTLASIFCIQPTFNATVDAAGDLPGPGAVTLQGKAQLLP